MSSSVQLTVDAARSTATRLGHQTSISGSNVSTTDGTTSGVVGNAVLMTSDGFTGASSVVTASQATAGEAFSFSASYLQGDAVPASAATVGDRRTHRNDGCLACLPKQYRGDFNGKTVDEPNTRSDQSLEANPCLFKTQVYSQLTY